MVQEGRKIKETDKKIHELEKEASVFVRNGIFFVSKEELDAHPELRKIKADIRRLDKLNERRNEKLSEIEDGGNWISFNSSNGKRIKTISFDALYGNSKKNNNMKRFESLNRHPLFVDDVKNILKGNTMECLARKQV
jgi:hypothetical protein